MTAFWWAYGLTLLAIVALCVAAGLVFGRTVWGVLIDDRNTFSLAQFQLVLWFLVVAPLYVGMLWLRIRSTSSASIDVSIPDELLVLLGVSASTTVLAAGVKHQKNQLDGALAAADRVPVRDAPKDARPLDMIAYDEGKNALAAVDITKLQSLVFTIALAVAYLASAFTLLRNTSEPTALTSLPALSGAATVLLGISNAGYVTGKSLGQSGRPDDKYKTAAQAFGEDAKTDVDGTATTGTGMPPALPQQPTPNPSRHPLRSSTLAHAEADGHQLVDVIVHVG